MFRNLNFDFINDSYPATGTFVVFMLQRNLYLFNDKGIISLYGNLSTYIYLFMFISRFIAVMHADTDGVVPGNALVVDPKKQFRKITTIHIGSFHTINYIFQNYIRFIFKITTRYILYFV